MKIKRTLFFLTALWWFIPGLAQSPGSTLPNVIFIYADDLGYGDLSCYGADSIHTPYLDQMAAEGIKFTNFYVTSPVCSPSRIGLLTGRYQVRSGITRVFFPNSLQGIDSTEYTMAELFKEAGYATGIIGKWHLGHLPPFLPMGHGFDYWFGIPYSNGIPLRQLTSSHYTNQNLFSCISRTISRISPCMSLPSMQGLRLMVNTGTWCRNWTVVWGKY